ncbi:uncharacterized protein FIBRA_00503 [Fibroporia radiculosa]|uniref:Uncharacterized protein n=1 Tax=Fibroporia radiculosa TaxID=599839 RepID=J4H043_9APHY|nr:uncharacterized protein FIBRA_00503 [Fibroporia radiculosa]CCL98504.1 predicted protein [Fibroporia radiculosa]
MFSQPSTSAAPYSPPPPNASRVAPPMLSYSQSNPIDLTLDEDEDGDDNGNDAYHSSDRKCKRTCTSSRSFNASSDYSRDDIDSHYQPHQSSGLSPVMSASTLLPPIAQHPSWLSHQMSTGPVPPIPNTIQPPPFTGPSNSSAFFPPRPKPAYNSPPSNRHRLSPQSNADFSHLSASTSRQVIDLTNSPSPSPPPATPLLMHHQQGNLPNDLPPKTPVCIGQLTVTALVLYPIPYLLFKEPQSAGPDTEWAPVRLSYEHTPHKATGQETIHIKTPSAKLPTGEIIQGENFAVVEQKAATFLGPMLGKGLIRLDAKKAKLPILPLQLLVYTPKGNIPVVANYLHQSGLLLDHPSIPSDHQRLLTQYYFNPHNPPPGGHARSPAGLSNRLGYAGPGGASGGRWSTPLVSGKSVEVQRSQVDELFKNLKDGDELQETEAPSEVATKLYPHQKKALTFLLEREREHVGPLGKHTSLWQERYNPLSGQISWYHVVTQRETKEEPQEAKSAILADDMGLGKTITCVSLIAATLRSARDFSASPLTRPASPSGSPEPGLDPSHFAESVWGIPVKQESNNAKEKGKSNREQDREQAEYARACRIKAKSRATLIVCPLSTVVNWEDQFREHWRGEVTVVGGAGGTICSTPSTPQTGFASSSLYTFSATSQQADDVKLEVQKPSGRVREGTPLRVYVYHGNARRPDPAFLANFDAVITTYATLASEYSKQVKSIATVGEEEDGDSSSDGEAVIDERGNQILKIPRAKKSGTKKRKKGGGKASGCAEVSSALQSVHWFRVVLDEAHSIKETSTVGCRASCDLVADRRLCLTGTPVQNKLDDVYALVKFLRLSPLDDKGVWTEFIGTPVKYGQPLGVARLQTIMKCITLRRTKESRAEDGRKILSLPPRRDELRYLRFDEQEQGVYDQFFTESKAEFNELSDKNEVMKNYVGILQKILRLRQICDHFELVRDKGIGDGQQGSPLAYDDIVAAVARDGINAQRAAALFALLREAGITQCVECGGELAGSADSALGDSAIGDGDGSSTPKRGRKPKASASRASTRQNSPTAPHPVLTRCQHLFCVGCLRNSIAPGWPGGAGDVTRCCSVCQTALSADDIVEVNPDCSLLDFAPKKKAAKKEKRQKGIAMENFHPSTKVRALLGDLMQFSKANPYSTNYDPTSIEVQMVDGQGNSLDDGVVKTVVFSQWTTMLDKIEDALELAGIRYDRLDGTMKRDERTRAMEALKHDPACEVLLVSLKAGGVGLNLTAAQRVYLMDPYWNPAVENQAVDRIHRLGQTRPVTTVKLIIENSIEARLLEVQRKKTELANMTLGSSFTKAEMLQRRMEELNQLFGT